MVQPNANHEYTHVFGGDLKINWVKLMTKTQDAILR